MWFGQVERRSQVHFPVIRCLIVVCIQVEWILQGRLLLRNRNVFRNAFPFQNCLQRAHQIDTNGNHRCFDLIVHHQLRLRSREQIHQGRNIRFLQSHSKRLCSSKLLWHLLCALRCRFRCLFGHLRLPSRPKNSHMLNRKCQEDMLVFLCSSFRRSILSHPSLRPFEFQLFYFQSQLLGPWLHKRLVLY